MRSGQPHHDCVLLHLLRIGEYTTKGTHNNSKQTEEFKIGDITFFAKDKQGNLCCLPWNDTLDLIAVADGATMKLDNQKNGKDKQGNLRCLPWNDTSDLIAAADGATIKLDNQKNGWKGVCVYQKSNGDPFKLPCQSTWQTYPTSSRQWGYKDNYHLVVFQRGKTL